MILILKKLFTTDHVLPSEPDLEHILQVATATLLIEVSRADFKQEESEVEQMRHLLTEQFKLTTEELDELLSLASDKADHLISLQHITRLFNEQFDSAMKIRVIEMMWQVVYADGVKDHYEEHLIRQVAELLYISHAAFVQARHKAEQAIIE